MSKRGYSDQLSVEKYIGIIGNMQEQISHLKNSIQPLEDQKIQLEQTLKMQENNRK